MNKLNWNESLAFFLYNYQSDSDEDAVIPPKKLYSDGYELLE